MGTLKIYPCPNPNCGAEMFLRKRDGEEIFFLQCAACGFPGPKKYSGRDAIDAWNAIPRMSTIIAWQFQAAGLALALQRIVSARAEADELKKRCYWACPRENIENWRAAIDRFEVALADARNAMEAPHDRR